MSTRRYRSRRVTSVHAHGWARQGERTGYRCSLAQAQIASRCLRAGHYSERARRGMGFTPHRARPGGVVQPLVLRPGCVPVVDTVELAHQAPELAVLSAMAHGGGPIATALQIALAASTAFSSPRRAASTQPRRR